MFEVSHFVYRSRWCRSIRGPSTAGATSHSVPCADVKAGERASHRVRREIVRQLRPLAHVPEVLLDQPLTVRCPAPGGEDPWWNRSSTLLHRQRLPLAGMRGRDRAERGSMHADPAEDGCAAADPPIHGRTRKSPSVGVSTVAGTREVALDISYYEARHHGQRDRRQREARRWDPAGDQRRDRAYVVMAAQYTFKQKDVPMETTAQMTFAPTKEKDGWRISRWTYSAPQGRRRSSRNDAMAWLGRPEAQGVHS